MATIDDVITWALGLRGWQADSVRRLLLLGEQPLSAEQYREILAMAKADLKLAPAPENLKPIPPGPGQFSGAPAETAAIQLLSIDDIRYVNIIKAGQTLPFARCGVTVVYGDNGSGKSGYSRILKLACQARDKDESILPDIFATTPTALPTAKLYILQDGLPKEIIWTQGVTADPILTNITVFDGRCARIITDDRNEISYLPYGCDVFQKLAELVVRVRADVAAEISVPVPVQDSALVQGTVAARFLESLSENTSDEALQAATRWTQEDEADLGYQEELARLSDPAKAIQEVAYLERVKVRVDDLATTMAGLGAACAELTIEVTRDALAKVHAAKLAHAASMAERQSPEPLRGVASTSQWEILYKAAKQYSEEIAYEGEPFPKTDDAVCVLCQQPLGKEAVARFGRFKRFMEDATSDVLAAKRNELRLFRDKVGTLAPLSAAALESICDEVAMLDAKVADDVRYFHTMVANRKAATLAVLVEDEDPEQALSLPPWPGSTEQPLRLLADGVAHRATSIRNAAKPEEYQIRIGHIAERRSQKALSARKADINAFLAKARRNAQLRSAVATLRTQDITRQGTSIIRKNLTPELLNAFRDELKALGAARLPVSLKAHGETGETAHEMQLDGANIPGKIRMSEILSEGEARVIAIAGFLAELRLAPHANAIVLDDPVSSLDHVFALKIAARLAREGLERQVIIFTHNISFLVELREACHALALSGTPVGCSVHTLRREGQLAGVTTDGAPWYALGVNQRAQYLDELVHKMKPLYPDNMADYNDKAAHVYGLLREAWESCIEDDLFYNVVCRYRNSVQTLKLNQVSIEDSDVSAIELHMSKASTWMTGHDKSKALHHDRPGPDELLADINALRALSKHLNSRRGQTEKRRKKQLEPCG